MYSTNSISRNTMIFTTITRRYVMTGRTLLLRSLLLLAVLTTSVLAAPSVQAAPETLTIAAANSLKDAFRQLLPLFEAHNKDINVRVIYGTSKTLTKQIEEGAPVDVFLPSQIEDIEQLEKKGLVIQGTKRVYAGTSLVLIAGPEFPAPITSIQDLRTTLVRYIAVGGGKSGGSVFQLQQARFPTEIAICLWRAFASCSGPGCQRRSRHRRRL